MVSAFTLHLTFAALILEALVGYPNAVYRVLGHPVTWMGAWLSGLERKLNDPLASFARRRVAGALALLIFLAPIAFIGVALQRLAATGAWGFACLAVIGAALPAQRSLDAHVRGVADTLERSGLQSGREAVAKIVGRDVQVLDEAGVCRAALESLAENFADGVVAPLIWMAIGGLPGAALYKAINTADSMIGHKSHRYLAFGWAAARLDDLVNLPASRLSALWLWLAACVTPGASASQAATAIWRDAQRHNSPNAGWPEAALAGALGLKLAGPRLYSDGLADAAYMGDGRLAANVADIRRGLALYRLACLAQALALGAAIILVAFA